MIQHLELTNFRNYEKFALDFNKTTILVGPNGIGKTNILEAIFLVSLGRSWRTNLDNEVISWQITGEVPGFAKISLLEKREGKNAQISLVIQKNPENAQLKLIKINDVKKRLSDLLGKTPVVLFSPEDIQIVRGAPALRRRLLDMMLCQLERKFVIALLDYGKILKGRNKLLGLIRQGRGKEDELDFWDEKLVILGTFIMKKRKEVIVFFNQRLATIYHEISGENDTLELKYRQSVPEDKFAESLVASREREIQQEMTLIGPHRDDLKIYLNYRDLTTFGSRGEYRSAILALKIAEVEYLTQKIGERPALLLDDIFSELDQKRRVHLGKIVIEGQTIITTTDLDHIEKGLREKAKIVDLK